ncbi:MAG: TAT-variant-translocated molybdopterin oxidoreductase [Phycisphaeraceae bacterium]|nr:TAT-variant-translocated molybdopterin oxidoreductase [Phycisphaeraceae bacterium]MCW5767363.1 TAT-variant-translocated molybdopterin oxidoreductase [Phycisphaeraceae bacterium]
MSHDQCPSTKGKLTPDANRREPDRVNAGLAGGAKYWRSVEEFADSGEYRDFLEREFPAGASELDAASRRDFIKVMGASFALAGAATIPGCRRPDHKILSYSREVPEDVIPGKPLYYATSMPLPGGGAEGLVVETHEGRPTKIEGNPLHPINRGKASVWSLASILGLYDPDRLKQPAYQNPARGRLPASWDDFATWSKDHFATYASNGGEGLVFLADKKSSPTRDAMRDAVLKKFPKAVWSAYDAGEAEGASRGSEIAFGKPGREIFTLSKARVILSLDRDFVEQEPASLVHARELAATRAVMTSQDEMSRVYMVESGFSHAGSNADHRLRVSPARIGAYAIAIARAVCERLGSNASTLGAAVAMATFEPGPDIDQKFINAVADDLVDGANRGRSAIMAGAAQSPAVHAIVHGLNALLGNVGNTVTYCQMSAEEASSSTASVAAVAEMLATGRATTLVMLNVNPAYDAPADLDFAARMAKATTITLSVDANETESISTWSLNGTHYLESWGDTIAADGTLSPVQPMIAPLYAPAHSDIELLAMIAGHSTTDGFEIVRATWKGVMPGDFEKSWRRSLHDGVAPVSPRSPAAWPANMGAIAEAARTLAVGPAPSKDSLDLAFTTGRIYDGRYANHAWLQELPDVGTRVVWDNPALVSPATARALGIEPVGYSDKDPSRIYTKPKYPHAQMATLAIGGRSMQVPVWILPGMADNTVLFPLGYGRRVCGHVGGNESDPVGFDANKVRESKSGRIVRNVRLTRSSGTHLIASTQNHWSMEGRTAIVRSVDLPAWKKFGDQPPVSEPDPIYAGKVKELSFAEKLGELSHTPPNIGIYANPFNESLVDPKPGARYSRGPQWGMTIDLSSCTGCGACTIACQSENNIPVVGKKETAKGREMTWIRVDRYFIGDDINTPEAMYHQPVACVHCENAPCETVCPVNATAHGTEGTNDMAYNRCIGTRYCANNCPYKVRRFNFFDYAVTKFNGSYYGKDLMPGGGPKNVNLIPPRLRQKLDEISRMKMNPDVTVRSRGVMEKCSYCMQRINAARVETKLQGLPGIPDGFFQVACQQACPSNAITFGDILDESSKVSKARQNQRSYMLLGYLNTRPRTSHMVRVSNPNPKLRKPVEDPFHHGYGDHGHEEHGGHPDAHGNGHAFFDSRKRSTDDGYALSLRVLGASAGVHA